MYNQIKSILDAMRNQLSDRDWNQTAGVAFLVELEHKLSDLNPLFLDAVVSSMKVEISNDTDPVEVVQLASEYAKVVQAMVSNSSFLALSPRVQQNVLRSLTFTYNP